MVTYQKYCSPCTDHGLHGYAALELDKYIVAGSVFFGEDYSRIVSSSRYRNLTDSRHMIMYFLKSYTNYTLTDIGRGFGDRNHTTIIHAIKQVKNMCYTSKPYNEKYNSLVEHLKKM